MQPVSSFVRKWRDDERGSIIPLFALMFIVLAGFSGLAMDYARQERMRARLAQAADAASLAAARAAASVQENHPSTDIGEVILQAQDIGRNSFKANLKDLGDVRIGSFDVAVSFEGGFWSVKSAYRASGKTTMGAAMGHGEMVLDGKAEASISPGLPVLDIAMCVDRTGSMSATLDAVKTNAINFYDNLNAALAAKGIPPFPQIRVRLIYYQDFGDINGYADPDPMIMSNFFALPDEKGNFNSYASPVMAGYGGDGPESGLECLNEAMSSPWMKPGDHIAGFTQPVTDVYPLIVIWTDAPSHPPGFPNSLTNALYPSAAQMPRTASDMLDKWNDAEVIDQKNKQILFFGDPDFMYSVQDQTDASGVFYPSGWLDVKTWPHFTVGGTLLEANTDPVEFIANGVAKTTKGLRLTN